MRKSKILAFSLVVILAFTANAVAKEKAFTNDPTLWGKPSVAIGSDEDQQAYDAGAKKDSRIQFVSARVFGMNNAARVTTSLGGANVLDHGGAVLSTAIIHPVWWGPSFPTGYQDGIRTFLSGLTCSNCSTSLSGLVKQYFRNAPSNVSYGAEYSDLSTPPTSAPTTATLVAEVSAVLSAAGAPVDPNGFYMVFTSNFPSQANYCAWHAAGAYNSSWFTLAYQPNLSGVSGCSASALPGYKSSTKNLAVDSIANVGTHELYEAMTDALLNNTYAWYDKFGSEVGDKCAWKTSTTITSGGLTYVVQQEWSNAKSACSGS